LKSHDKKQGLENIPKGGCLFGISEASDSFSRAYQGYWSMIISEIIHMRSSKILLDCLEAGGFSVKTMCGKMTVGFSLPW